MVKEKYTICENCGRKYIYDRHKNHRKTKCNTCVTNARRFKLKSEMVEYKGGKCEKCGYNKCMSALTFHHKNPKEKSFIISGSHCVSREKIFKEVNKCMLVCFNCHMELHYEKRT